MKDYFKNKLKSIFKENEDTLIEIKKCKFFSSYKKSCIEKLLGMSKEIKNKDIYQYFGDATYRCVPPTFRKYRLYILFVFNLNLKKL